MRVVGGEVDGAAKTDQVVDAIELASYTQIAPFTFDTPRCDNFFAIKVRCHGSPVSKTGETYVPNFRPR